jgi:hypothetical protein
MLTYAIRELACRYVCYDLLFIKSLFMYPFFKKIVIIITIYDLDPIVKYPQMDVELF